jgi:hypothetical protein
MVLGCRKPKLAGLRSTSGSRRSSGCTGSGFRGDVGGCRRWPGTASEVGWREVIGAEKLSGMRVCKRKDKCMRSVWMCSGSQRGCGRAEAGAVTPAARVAAQRNAGSSNATWGTRVRDSTRSGGRWHGRGVTRGIAGKQEVVRDCYNGEQRRGAARVGSRVAWRGEEEPARGREAVGQRLRRHVDGRRAALGRQGWRTWPARAAAARGRETEERGREVDEGGPGCKLQKIQGLHCNA